MLKSIAVLLLFGLAGAYLFLANPWNWFVPHSEKFSWETFKEVKPGDKVERAAARLGKPTVTMLYSDQVECPGCTIAFFAGPPPEWLISFREAFLVVDPSGTIVITRIHTEP